MIQIRWPMADPKNDTQAVDPRFRVTWLPIDSRVDPTSLEPEAKENIGVLARLESDRPAPTAVGRLDDGSTT
jgi:hypothetical protein